MCMVDINTTIVYSDGNMVKSVLSQPNSVTLLVYLLESGGSAKTSHIQDAVGNYNSVKSAGERLEKEGLVTITEHTGQSRYMLYELTEKGRDVAKHLKKAEDALQGILAEEDDYVSASGAVLSQINGEEKKD